LEYVRSNGVLQADYSLRVDSACIAAGANARVQGVANLCDADGMRVTDGSGEIVVGGGRLSIGALQPTLQVVSGEIPRAVAGAAYEFVIEAIGGVGVHYWSVVTGSQMPEGLTLTESGRLWGVPTYVGNFEFTVEVADEAGNSVQRGFALQVDPTQPPSIESLSMQSDGSPRLVVSSDHDGVLSVDATANLEYWDNIDAVVVTNGMGVWDGIGDANSQNRYYRLRR
jgi:hypothetical protein